MGITSELIDFEAIEKIEKELKKDSHITDNAVRLVKRSEEDVYEDIMKNGKSYDIEGGLRTLKKYISNKKRGK